MSLNTPSDKFGDMDFEDMQDEQFDYGDFLDPNPDEGEAYDELDFHDHPELGDSPVHFVEDLEDRIDQELAKGDEDEASED